MNSKDSFTGPVNLGNPDEIEIKYLAEKIIQMTDSKSLIKYRELPKDDPLKRKPDISLAIQKLKWLPKISLDEGLSSTISYFKTIS